VALNRFYKRWEKDEKSYPGTRVRRKDDAMKTNAGTINLLLLLRFFGVYKLHLADEVFCVGKLIDDERTITDIDHDVSANVCIKINIIYGSLPCTIEVEAIKKAALKGRSLF